MINCRSSPKNQREREKNCELGVGGYKGLRRNQIPDLKKLEKGKQNMEGSGERIS